MVEFIYFFLFLFLFLFLSLLRLLRLSLSLSVSLLEQLSPECIQIHRNSDGRPSGEAVVNFQNHAEAERAIQVKNRHNIGTRYIELFMA